MKKPKIFGWLETLEAVALDMQLNDHFALGHELEAIVKEIRREYSILRQEDYEDFATRKNQLKFNFHIR